jgi:hypothetical protein
MPPKIARKKISIFQPLLLIVDFNVGLGLGDGGAHCFHVSFHPLSLLHQLLVLGCEIEVPQCVHALGPAKDFVEALVQ